MSSTQTSIETGRYYHLYNHANEGFDLFRNPENYRFFLQKFIKYLHPITDTFAYCLMPNHFHFAIRIKRVDESETLMKSDHPNRIVTNAIKNWLLSYSKSYHSVFSTRRNLYYQKVRRKEITSEEYLFRLIGYIHMNPLQHGFTKKPGTWKYSSYQGYLSEKETLIKRSSIIEMFGGIENFLIYHDLKKADIFAEENDLEY